MNLETILAIKLPSRYEDLDPAFRGRLRPNPSLITLVQRAASGMTVSGGLRFLPLFGKSGSGKSSAVRELATHLPDCVVTEVSRAAIQSEVQFVSEVNAARGSRDHPRMVIAVVDQYEEQVAQQADVPSQFVERLSLLDRGEIGKVGLLVVWLTTSRPFQDALVNATTRNSRILLDSGFELVGPERDEWASIIEETFDFHNNGESLADHEILGGDLVSISDESATIGAAIEKVGERLSSQVSGLQDLSQYQVMMLWPVADGLRIQRIQSFTHPREGYRLNWGAFYRELSNDDRRTLPLPAFNRTRLYFDVRLVPIAVADLHRLCLKLEDEDPTVGPSYLTRLSKSHFVSLLNEQWNPETYSPLRERTSQRAQQAREWYSSVTTNPVGLGRRLALCLRRIDIPAKHEVDVSSTYSKVRADMLVERPDSTQSKVIVELKAFSSDNTMPSAVRDAIRTTLRRHAQFAGFLPKA